MPQLASRTLVHDSISSHIGEMTADVGKLLEADKSLARKFDRLERKLESHDQTIVGILSAIRHLMNPSETKRRGIGFTANLED